MSLKELFSLYALTLILLGGWASQALAAVKDQCLHSLSIMRKQNQNNLSEIEHKIQTLLRGTPTNAKLLGKPSLSQIENQVETLNHLRQKYLYRQEFLNRLILVVDSNYKGGSLKQFLHQQLPQMARIDLFDARGGRHLWRFMTNLNQVIQDLPSHDTNILANIHSYMEASSFKHPLSADSYLKSRDYTNSGESVAVNTISPDKVGDYLDKTLKAKNRTVKPATVIP